MTKNKFICSELNKAIISKYLSHDVASCLEELQVLDRIGSTNDEVFNRRAQKPVNVTGRFNVCVANQQTAGRGRDGKVWQSPPDANIYISIGVALDVALLKKLNAVSLACGVVLARLFESMGVTCGLKWPNDILVNDKKLAGVLVETRIQSDQIYVVLGVGVNINMSAHAANNIDQLGIDQPWIDLKQIVTDNNRLQNRNKLVAKLITSLTYCLQQFQVSGFDSFFADWQRFEVLTGRDVIIKSKAGEVSAKVLGYNSDYSLRANVNKQEKTFYAADIKLRMAKNAGN